MFVLFGNRLAEDNKKHNFKLDQEEIRPVITKRSQYIQHTWQAEAASQPKYHRYYTILKDSTQHEENTVDTQIVIAEYKV